ncbi:MAG TPA: PAS domain-containing protein [Dissulfurispiraceae bacterium]|nr:PAS domain-containing protein [Dissulfurispiraceae bacterium]
MKRIQKQMFGSLAELEATEGMPLASTDSRIGTFHMDVLGVIDRVHSRFLDITGGRSEEMIGRVWLQTVTCDDRDRVCKEWYLSIMKKKAFACSFMILDLARGGLKKVSCSLVPELSDYGRTIGYFGAFIEIAGAAAMNGTSAMIAS